MRNERPSKRLANISVSVSSLAKPLPEPWLDKVRLQLRTESKNVLSAYFFGMRVGDEAPLVALGVRLRQPGDSSAQGKLREHIIHKVETLFNELEIRARFLFLEDDLFSAVQQVSQPFLVLDTMTM